MRLHELECYKSGWNALNVSADGDVTISNIKQRKIWKIKVKDLGTPKERVVSVKEEKMKPGE